MRKKYRGFILQFTRADHEGRHIHVFKDDRLIGVYDRIDGPIRGLDRHWNKELPEAPNQFTADLNERGYYT